MKYNKGAILRSIEQPFIKDNLPEFDTGDTVRVDYKVVEGNRSRIQAFEGVVIARQNGKGARSSFTVRKVSFSEGVERVFPLHSPLIDNIEVLRRGRTRRAKLYYLRDLRGKAARLRTDLGRQEVDRAAARAAKNAKNKPKAAAPQAEDDLSKIEGVGPKRADALVSAGLNSYRAIAEASEEQFKEALESADMNVAASISTWAKQAQYLVDGDEEGLKAYQDELNGGRE